MSTDVSYQELEAMADAATSLTVLGGYSGAGYDAESLASLEQEVRKMVTTNGDNAMYVIGATPDGVGAAYDWIRDQATKDGLNEVVTAGIVSEAGKKYGAAAKCDNVVWVADPDNTWQVNDENGKSLMIKIAGDRPEKSTVAYFGGGGVSKAELDQATGYEGLNVLVASNDEFVPLKPEKLKGEKPVNDWMASNEGRFKAVTRTGSVAMAKENMENKADGGDGPVPTAGPVVS